ncbi:zinc metalloprotease [Flaviramulus sp. BrNp1-15]|uniref:zinc metalloprotease n=1 Tax=Flaviramulus sp. BrNp1-15 TaxID=2916754 RepID=UPI001EE89FBC|nr:zinc metalloprotease [Flaviramulus sp. BrNp1-15]ULC59951.1 zinc metalloprotease [Flaviramulus sp. BrNp1-15]
MKRLFLSMAAVALLFTACDDDKNEITQEQEIDMSDFYLYTDLNEDVASKSNNGKDKTKTCYSMNVLNRQLDENPGLAKKMYDVEYHTRKFIAAKGKPTNPGNGGGGGGGEEPTPDNLGVINIPVNVIVVYSNSNENISNAQISSQIAVLNSDFRKTNNDVNQAPSEFAGLAADSEITFTLANTFRYSSTTTSWGTSNAVKSAYPPVSPETHLNIWVCNIGGGILGYAQFPGGSLATDGVVCSPQFFGTTGYVQAPFDKGRTMTHEVGHYLNLRHIWGDGRCKQDDFVSDTPSSDGPNYGCPSYPTVNCRTNDMTMNYMDYVDDACMYMFSEGQKSRMRAIFASGGARESMLP